VTSTPEAIDIHGGEAVDAGAIKALVRAASPMHAAAESALLRRQPPRLILLGGCAAAAASALAADAPIR